MERGSVVNNVFILGLQWNTAASRCAVYRSNSLWESLYRIEHKSHCCSRKFAVCDCLLPQFGNKYSCDPLNYARVLVNIYFTECIRANIINFIRRDDAFLRVNKTMVGNNNNNESSGTRFFNTLQNFIKIYSKTRTCILYYF